MIITFLKALGRRLTPPGNRGSLETSHRQPTADGTYVGSLGGSSMHSHGVTH